MNIAQIITNDIANGKGIRLSVFVSGCNIHCGGCFNEIAWDFNYGQKLTDKLLNHIYNELAKSQYDGITILGGEPLDPLNQEGILTILEKIKDLKKNVWLYTGYNKNSIPKTEFTDKILKNIDILIDGPFIEEQKDLSIAFRGSSNQNIIDIKTGNTLDFDKKEENNESKI